MKYLINENNTCGQASLTESQRRSLLEQLGFTTPQEEEEQITEAVEAPEAVETEEVVAQEEDAAPALYEWDGSVFALDEEVFELEGELFVRAFELDGETTMGLDESHADLFVNEVSFDSDDYNLGDIYDFGDETFIKLDEAYMKEKKMKKGEMKKDEKEMDESMEDRIKAIKARDDERRKQGKPAPKPAPKIGVPGQADGSDVTDAEVDKATKGVQAAKGKDAEKAAKAHGDK
jgi:hypothetical protein